MRLWRVEISFYFSLESFYYLRALPQFRVKYIHNMRKQNTTISIYSMSSKKSFFRLSVYIFGSPVSTLTIKGNSDNSETL